jgi:serine/threonine-protein kinase
MIKLVERSLGAGPRIIKEIKTGNVFAECFRIEERMHESMMSVVFRARDLPASRRVVLKMTDNTDHRRFYDTEAKILGDNLHPAFPELYERGRAGNIDYNSLEYISGSTLLERNHRLNPLSLTKTIGVIKTVLDCLTPLHQRSLIFHDISPANIMLEWSGRTRLIDPAIAGQSMLVTRKVGTEGFAPPEQTEENVIDQFKTSPSSDIYALGQVFYFMLIGLAPDSCWKDMQKAFKFRFRHYDLTKEPFHSVRSQLENIVIKMTEPRPAERYQSSAEVMPDLNELEVSAQQLEAKYPPLMML